VSDLRKDHWYRVSFFSAGQERQALGKYLGLSTWMDLPEHKHGEPSPQGAGDVVFHWFSVRDQNWPLSIRPDDVIRVLETAEPPSRSPLSRKTYR
jgi:hypothetical protein